MKKCLDCNKTSNSFPKDKRNKDGMGPYCKKCHLKRVAITRKKKWEHYKKYIREYMRLYREKKEKPLCIKSYKLPDLPKAKTYKDYLRQAGYKI